MSHIFGMYNSTNIMKISNRNKWLVFNQKSTYCDLRVYPKKCAVARDIIINQLFHIPFDLIFNHIGNLNLLLMSFVTFFAVGCGFQLSNKLIITMKKVLGQ